MLGRCTPSPFHLAKESRTIMTEQPRRRRVVRRSKTETEPPRSNLTPPTEIPGLPRSGGPLSPNVVVNPDIDVTVTLDAKAFMWLWTKAEYRAWEEWRRYHSDPSLVDHVDSAKRSVTAMRIAATRSGLIRTRSVKIPRKSMTSSSSKSSSKRSSNSSSMINSKKRVVSKKVK